MMSSDMAEERSAAARLPTAATGSDFHWPSLVSRQYSNGAMLCILLTRFSFLTY